MMILICGKARLIRAAASSPQFKQLAGHGLILDDHHLVFHSIACLSRCKISVS